MYLTIKVPIKASKEEKQILQAYSKCFRDEVERIASRYQTLKQVVFIPYKWISSSIAFQSVKII